MDYTIEDVMESLVEQGGSECTSKRALRIYLRVNGKLSPHFQD